MQHHAADQLDVEVAHAEFALAGFADDRKGLRHQVIKRLAGGVTLAELVRLGAQLLVAQDLDGGLERIDALDRLSVLFDQPVVAAAENFSE